MLKNTQKAYNEHREATWFAKNLERGKREVFAELVTITPTLAEIMLDGNSDNRKVKNYVLSEVIQDIKQGRWELNGETIIVASDGFLNDGQHRLMACIETGRSMETLVAFGLPRASRFTVDMGKPRTTQEFMGMQGVKNANNVASVIRMYDCYERGVFNRRGPWQTRTYLLDFYNEHAEELEHATSHAQVTIARSLGLPSYAFTYLILRKINPEECEWFFQRLADGANLERTDPILIARNHLIQGDRLEVHHRAALLFMYWNAWRKGRSIMRSFSVPKEWPTIVE